MYQNTELNRDNSGIIFLSLIFYQHPCQSKIIKLVMWNYLSGVKPPSEFEKKKKKFESTKEYYYKGYDKDKHARKYLPEWEKGRPWLKYVDDKGMVCTA